MLIHPPTTASMMAMKIGKRKKCKANRVGLVHFESPGPVSPDCPLFGETSLASLLFLGEKKQDHRTWNLQHTIAIRPSWLQTRGAKGPRFAKWIQKWALASPGVSWQAPEPSPWCELWRIQWHIFNLSECLPLTLCQKTNHTPPRIEHTASDTLVLVVVPVSPLLHVSCAKLRNVNKGVYNNLCDGNIALPSWYWRIRWTG